MNYTHFLNGQWVKNSDLKIPAADLAVLRGYAVFDYLRTHGRKTLRLEDNLNRFFESAKLLGLKVPYPRQRVASIINEGIVHNPTGELGIRFVLTGGAGVDSKTLGQPNFFIIYSDPAWPTQQQFRQGVKVVTLASPRYLAAAKHTDYALAIKANQAAAKHGAVEAVYIDPPGFKNPKIYEATNSNLFIIKQNGVITPKEGVLPGVTAKIVLDLAAALKIPIKQQAITLKEALSADESFLTSAVKGILPVVQIDDNTIGHGQPGPVTQQLLQAFNALIKSL